MLEFAGILSKRASRFCAIYLRYIVVSIYLLVVSFGASIGGLAAWASILLGGSLYPILDAVPWRGFDARESSVSTHHRSKLQVFGLYLVAQSAVIFWILYLTTVRDYTMWEWVGIGLSLGTLTGGIGIPAAHELIHCKSRLGRAMGLYLLMTVNYMHFRIEHIYGHHRHVATPQDPATARKGEGLWQFIPRSIVGQIKGAYSIDERMRNKKGKRLGLPNRVVQYAAIQAGVLGVVYISFGSVGLWLMLIQSITAIIFLEATNYVEHYGLLRQEYNGRREAVSELHSWSTGSLLTNSIAFNLGLHADHHAHPDRPFSELRNLITAPQLPAGYLAMFSIAAVPPIWTRMMDPRVDRLLERQSEKSPNHKLQKESTNGPQY